MFFKDIPKLVSFGLFKFLSSNAISLEEVLVFTFFNAVISLPTWQQL